MENKNIDQEQNKIIPHELPHEVYLERLSDTDRNNVQTLEIRFHDIMKAMQKHGALIVVGGTVRDDYAKEKPRKDIDILLIIENNQPEDEGMSPLEKTEEKFKLFSQVVEALAVDNDQVASSRFEKANTIEPYPEFDNPSIPRHEGAITLKPPSGMPIEFVNRHLGGNVDEELHSQRYPEMGRQAKPFSLLIRV